MTQTEHKKCFGTMFPDELHLKVNEPNKGKVFTVFMSSKGGMANVRSDRSIEVNIEEWDDCNKCPELDSCYKLCLAKVALESAIVTQ